MSWIIRPKPKVPIPEGYEERGGLLVPVVDRDNSGPWVTFSSPLKFVANYVSFGNDDDSPPAPVEELATEIIAWRSWKLDKVQGRNGEAVLRSFTMKTVWEGPTLRADAKPSQTLGHGIYALKKQPVDNPNHWVENHYGYYSGAAVHGTVALSGVCVLGENGYRAEVATIQSLILRPSARWPKSLRKTRTMMEVAHQLEERYQVTVEMESNAWVWD